MSFNLLRLSTAELAYAETAQLERIGKALAEKLTYLMEPISPIEIDAEGCVVQLRSNPPQRNDDGRSYYELIVRRGGEIALGATARKTAMPAIRSRPTLRAKCCCGLWAISGGVGLIFKLDRPSFSIVEANDNLRRKVES